MMTGQVLLTLAVTVLPAVGAYLCAAVFTAVRARAPGRRVLPGLGWLTAGAACGTATGLACAFLILLGFQRSDLVVPDLVLALLPGMPAAGVLVAGAVALWVTGSTVSLREPVRG